eukprot:Hpha_TRINITY_DN15321_c1_g13::TRINITY_DN15321_c1_g13_i1::g.89682::m.89682
MGGNNARTDECSILTFVSRANDGAVGLPDCRPKAGVLPHRHVRRPGEPSRSLLIELDPPAGLFVGPCGAVADLAHSGEYLTHRPRTVPRHAEVVHVPLLDTEVHRRQVQRHIRCHPDGARVSGPVQRQPHSEELTEVGDLPHGGQPADVRHVTTNKVDQPVLNQRQVLRLINEELPHGEGCRRVVAEQLEVVHLLRGEDVLEEEEAVGLKGLRKLDGTAARNTLVDVVEQLDLVTELLPRLLKKLGHKPHVGLRVEKARRGGRSVHLIPDFALTGPHVVSTSTRAVSRLARHRALQTDVLKTLLHEVLRVRDHLRDGGARGVDVHRDALAHLAPEQLVDRHAGKLTLDVPERLVHTTKRIVEHRTTPPVTGNLCGEENVFDLLHVTAPEKGVKVRFDCLHHTARTLGKGGAAQTVQPGLGGLDLHNYQTDATGRRGFDTPDLCDRYLLRCRLLLPRTLRRRRHCCSYPCLTSSYDNNKVQKL